jgi:hypothetical protein
LGPGRVGFSASLVLVLFLQLFTLQSTVAFSPLDSVTQNVAINATLSNLDLASSQHSFVPTQAPVIRLQWLWVSCGIDNRGPVASIRVYLSLASDSVVVYFEFVSVYGGWRGVARGYVDYGAPSFTTDLDPSGASRTGASVHYADNLVMAAGGGFNSVVRVWAEGSGISVYAGECQYGIGFESAQTSESASVPAVPSDNTANSVVLVAVITGIVSVTSAVIGIAVYSRKKRGAVRARRAAPAKSTLVCSSCGHENTSRNRFCGGCGRPLDDQTRLYY